MYIFQKCHFVIPEYLLVEMNIDELDNIVVITNLRYKV